MSNQTIAETLIPLVNAAKAIIPTLKNAHAAPGSGVDPQCIAAALEKSIVEWEGVIAATTLPTGSP